MATESVQKTIESMQKEIENMKHEMERLQAVHEIQNVMATYFHIHGATSML